MTPLKFTARPVPVEAMQYTTNNRDDVIAWSGAVHTGMDDDGAEYELMNLRLSDGVTDYLVCVGDWVVKNHLGEFSAMKSEVFGGMYRNSEADKPTLADIVRPGSRITVNGFEMDIAQVDGNQLVTENGSTITVTP